MGWHVEATPPFSAVCVQTSSGPTETVSPLGQFGAAAPPPGTVPSGYTNVHTLSVPSARISIRCAPLGKLPSARFTVAENWSAHATSPHSLLEQPCNVAAITRIPVQIKPLRMRSAYAARAIVAILSPMPSSPWPELRLAAWRDTYATLLLYSQIVGKIRLALAPKTNQWWNVTLHVSARGLITPPMPYGDRLFTIGFDFIDHRLVIEDSLGNVRSLALTSRAVCIFYAELMSTLAGIGIDVSIGTKPQECPLTTPFTDDREHAHYDRAAVQTLWQALSRIEPVFQKFRAGFRGKSSPVHFFWGAFDLAVSRFVGRRAPLRQTKVERDAYDEEVISLGFWPGDPWPEAGGTEAMFYSYTVPEPAGLSTTRVGPAGAGWNPTLKEFVLPYEEVRRASNPASAILEFAQSSYDAGATLAGWNREALAYP
jgi:Family of unknown function (DUF5996)